MGLIEQTLRNWVKAAAAGKLNGAGAKVVTPEQMELSRLRAENIRLKQECKILNAMCQIQIETRHNYEIPSFLQSITVVPAVNVETGVMFYEKFLQ